VLFHALGGVQATQHAHHMPQSLATEASDSKTVQHCRFRLRLSNVADEVASSRSG
jgi:hypothetical protein